MSVIRPALRGPSPVAPRHPRYPRLAACIAVIGEPKYVIAARAGMPPTVLGGIISGRVQPSHAAQARLAEVLGTSVAELFAEVTE